MDEASMSGQPEVAVGVAEGGHKEVEAASHHVVKEHLKGDVVEVFEVEEGLKAGMVELLGVEVDLVEIEAEEDSEVDVGSRMDMEEVMDNKVEVRVVTDQVVMVLVLIKIMITIAVIIRVVIHNLVVTSNQHMTIKAVILTVNNNKVVMVVVMKVTKSQLHQLHQDIMLKIATVPLQRQRVTEQLHPLVTVEVVTKHKLPRQLPHTELNHNLLVMDLLLLNMVAVMVVQRVMMLRNLLGDMVKVVDGNVELKSK